jgi:hypothetical protein
MGKGAGADHMSNHSVRLPRAVKVYWIATIVLSALALLIVGVRRYLLQEGYPYNTFIPGWKFTDLATYQERFKHLGTQAFFMYPGQPFNYPAPIAAVCAFFFREFSHPTRAFCLTFLAASLIATALLARALRNVGISVRIAGFFAITVLLTSYPFMVLFDLANTEIAVWIVLACGLVAFARDRLWIAAALIGIAGSMKIVPAIFFLLFLYRRRLLELSFGILTMEAVTLVSLWWLGPTMSIAQAGFQNGLDRFAEMYLYHWRPVENNFDHSLFGAIKTAFVYYKPSLDPHYFRHEYRIYFVVIAIVSTAIFLRLRKLPPLNQMVALACCALVLPPLSYDYTLMQLYVPFALLLLTTIRQQQPGRLEPFFLTRIFCYFAILFTPQSYLIRGKVGFGGQLKAIVLITLLAESLVRPFPADAEVVSQRRPGQSQRPS